MNIQSSDSSTNVVSVESAVLFDNLREVIQKSSLDSTVAQELIQNVNAMQSAAGTKTFGDRYKEFIAVAADHMTLVAPVPPGVDTTAAVKVSLIPAPLAAVTCARKGETRQAALRFASASPPSPQSIKSAHSPLP